MNKQQNFKRYEKKYLLNLEQYQSLRKHLETYMEEDSYGWSTICNIYYDTPTYQLIRSSIEKPVYKEKLRLRTYGIPSDDSLAFVELKKKYKGIVYKRRLSMPYSQAYQWLTQEIKNDANNQIMNEINWFRTFYPILLPKVALCYNRLALFGKEAKEVRITFDHAIRWRTSQTDLREGDQGLLLLPEENYLMEIKIYGAMPLWLTAILDKLKLYPTSFSKYGMVYKEMFIMKKELQ